MAQKDAGGWNTVDQKVDGTMAKFDAFGDVLIGRYDGPDKVERSDGSTMRQDRFTGTDDQPYFINTPYQLRQLLKDVPIGYWCRIEYTNDQPTGQASPMKIFALATRRDRPAA